MSNTEPVLIAGRYRLVTALATGGMGVVWKGWDERLERPVAVKQLRIQLGLSPSEAATARDRAMREARNTARLHHPHAVPVYDVVEQDGEPCLIMEFLPSISLQEAIRQRGMLPPGEVARIGSEVAQALSAAHKAGIVHRDVKPGNVLLGEDGTTKLTDFGISHALGDVALTQTGMLTGTPAYLAPEVARGLPASFASDVYSLGSTLYTATEGAPPYGQDANAMAVLHRVASGRFHPPQRSGALTPLLEQMLRADPDQRPRMPDVSRALASLHAAYSAAPTAHAAAASLPTASFDPPYRPPAPPLAAAPTLRDAHLLLGASPASAVAPGRALAPARARPRRQRGLVAALLAGALVIATVVVAFALTHRKGPDKSAGGGPTTSGSHPTRTARTTSRAASNPPSTHSTASNPPATSGQPAGAVTAAQLAQAITDYYELMPNNTTQGWTRLTPSYQQNTSHGYAAYQQFWSGFEKVTVSDVSGQAPDTVEAVVSYFRKSGGKSVERTRFRLVMSGGVLKIDGSTVF